MISLSEALSGIYQGVRDGNLGQIGTNVVDTTKNIVTGTADTVKAAGNALGDLGNHIVKNKENYLRGAGLGMGLLGTAYLFHQHDANCMPSQPAAG